MTDEKKKGQKSGMPVFNENYKIEMYKGKKHSALLICAVLKIIEYGSTRVELLTKTGRINVNGSCLFVHIYDGKRAEIVGRIESIEMP